MALSIERMRCLLALICLACVIACSGDAGGKTEVLVSIDAIGEARASSSVRIQVNAAVVELAARSGGRWPLEVLVRAPEGMADKTFRVRAWGLSGDVVNGAGEKEGSFRKGKRT